MLGSLGQSLLKHLYQNCSKSFEEENRGNYRELEINIHITYHLHILIWMYFSEVQRLQCGIVKPLLKRLNCHQSPVTFMTPQPRLERLEPSSHGWDVHNSHYWSIEKPYYIEKVNIDTVWFWWLPNELTKTRPASFVDPGGCCWLLIPSRIVLPKTRTKWNKQKLLHKKKCAEISSFF